MQTKTFLLLFFFFSRSIAFPQYWQQQVDYVIDVTLNDSEKTLDGFEKITYTNRSPDTLRYIWFHLWPNAYKNDRTALSDQMLQNGNNAFYFSSAQQKGYINRLDFKVNGMPAKTEDHPEHIDIVKLLLPSPLPPNAQIQISTPFHVKLPFNFSRGGYDGNSFQLTQWYPKPAVYDSKGWHPMPYLDQGEFYSEFGNFDVRITVPKPFVVAATGVLQNKEEKEWLKTKKYTAPEKGERMPVTYKKGVKKKEPVILLPPVQSETKTLHFLQSNVHDFAFFANARFVVEWDTCLLPSGKVIDVFSYYTPVQHKTWKNSMQYCKDAIRFYSEEVGEYPYEVVSAVQGPASFGGGMEYPTITAISPTHSARELDIILAHEIGHNWFYGILASNEREHPWMDEGMNTFYDKKYARKKYGRQHEAEEILFQTAARERTDQPIETPSKNFTSENYGLVAYYKTAKWLQWVEEKLGKETFKKAMQTYYSQWSFKHPQPQDFKNIFSPYLGPDSTSVFEWLYKTGPLPNQYLTGFKIISPLQPKSIRQYIQSPSARALLLSPAIGFNSYDKLMAGGIISNYTLPLSPLRFIALPLYSTGAKKLTGLGKISYVAHPAKTFSAVNFFFNASSFSMNDYTGENNTRHVFGFRKWVPGIELILKEKNPLSTIRKSLQWKSYFIQEEPLRIALDSVFTPGDTAIVERVQKEKINFRVHQFRAGIENHRSLYPYAAVFTAQGSSRFLRLSFEGTYFFNYAEGGLMVRLFGGKFFYNKEKRDPYGYNISRFFLNMTGANGEEDFTYSDYFVGRNRFEGLASQQIMIRDGGFKTRSDLLANKIGKTDNWLTAINFTTTVPDKINPLSALPFSVPVRLFADIGTYAGAWQGNGEEDRFLFDAGVQISLLNEAVSLYFPLFYSTAFSEYVKTTYTKNKLLNTMSFSINLHQAYKKLNRQVTF